MTALTHTNENASMRCPGSTMSNSRPPVEKNTSINNKKTRMTMQTTHVLNVVTTLMLGLAMLWTTSSACSCFPATFQELYDAADYVDAVYLFGEATVDDNGEFSGLVDTEATNVPTPAPAFAGRDIPFLVYISISFKGCSTEGQHELFVSVDQVNLCGVVDPRPGWYIMETQLDTTIGKRRMTLCDLRRRWGSFTWDEYHYAIDNQETTCTGSASPYKNP